MSEEEPTMATPSIMEVMQAMFNGLNNNINDINNNINDINNNINNNNSKFNSKIDDMQALSAAARIEMLELID